MHRFGPFELDLASGRLLRGAQRVPLSDTQSAILVQLVRHVGEVVPPDALIHASLGKHRGCGKQPPPGRPAAAPDARRGAERRNLYRDASHAGLPLCRGRQACRARRPGRAPLDARIAPHRAVVRGRAELETLDAAAIQRARRDLEDAVRQAPDYADAHVSLAMACGLIFESTSVDRRPDTASLQGGIEHARKSCELVPASGEAWSTLAFVF